MNSLKKYIWTSNTQGQHEGQSKPISQKIKDKSVLTPGQMRASWASAGTGRAHTAEGSNPRQLTQATASRPGLFLGPARRDPVDGQPHSFLYPLALTGQGRSVAMCSAVPRSIKLRLNFIFLFFLNSKFLHYHDLIFCL